MSNHLPAITAQLREWASIPSIAADPEHEDDLRASARWLAASLAAVGFPAVDIWDPDGSAAVFADWPAAPNAQGALTVLVYSHHDVRAVKAGQWEQCPPFEPILRGDRLYGRGTSDAKGQVLAHLWALRAHLAIGDEDGPPVHLKFLVEGEEEAGSPHLSALIDDHADQLRADLVMVSDTMTWAFDRPAVCAGIRGMMKATVTVRGARADVHAGSVAGAAPNASSELVRLLSTLHRNDAAVALPGFYDDVAPPSAAERTALAHLTADEGDWLRRAGLPAVDGEASGSLGELLYTRPSLDVLMLASGDSEPPTTGTIPAEASADIQVSLVPDQRPDRIAELLYAWLAAQERPPYEYAIDIEQTISQPPYVTPEGLPALGILSGAMARAWGCEIGLMRNAGGAPTALLAEKTGAPVMFFGTGLPEDSWHGSDESVDLRMVVNGAVTLAMFWEALGSSRRPLAP